MAAPEPFRPSEPSPAVRIPRTLSRIFGISTLVCILLSIFVSLPFLLIPPAILRFLGDAVEIGHDKNDLTLSWVLAKRSKVRAAWWVASNAATIAVLAVLFVAANHSLVYFIQNR